MLDHIGMQFELNCVSVMCVSLNVIILTMLVLPGLGKERALNGDVDVADLIRRVQQILSALIVTQELVQDSIYES